MKLQPSAVKHVALEHGLTVAQPRGLRLDGRWADDAAAAQQALAAAQPDVMVVAAYGLILPKWVLQLPRLGCLNIHASLLPRWRGAAPIHRAVEAGDARSGITIMQMDEGLDTGPMLLVESVALAPDETTATLHDRLAGLGGRLIVEALELAACGGLVSTPQPELGVTYAHKIDKAEAPIDWRLDSDAVARRVRAFDPFPGATCRMEAAAADEWIKVWKAIALGPSEAGTAQQDGSSAAPLRDGLAQAVDPPPPPGTVLAVTPAGVDVACGQGVLRLLEMQRPSARRQPAGLVAQALGLRAGSRLV